MLDNPIRGCLNAWLLAALDDYMHRHYAEIKLRLLDGHPPTVVELGSGAGANLHYLPAGTRLIAIEPNRHTHEILRRRAARRGIDIEIRGLMGEAMDLPDASVDFVFTSLVLCTVPDPGQVSAEVLRILRPGGKFVCVEHVAERHATGLRQLQRLLRHPWRYLFEGCDLCRDTAATLSRTGFSHLELEQIILPTAILPIRPHIAAICTK